MNSIPKQPADMVWISRPDTPPVGLRVMLYSHDSWGLGHLRRSLAIAGALLRHRTDTDLLVVTGSPCATQFDLPPRCDVLKLPTVSKDAEGMYVPRNLSASMAQTLEMRSRLITQAYRSYDPHVVIVDHQVTGLLGEALDMLRAARAQGKRLIYGLRDILDAPETVQQAWNRPDTRWALRTAYDRICVYGHPGVFDPLQQYPILKNFEKKLTYTGYIAAPLKPERRLPVPSLRKRVLVTVGGGEDGGQRVSAYIDALALAPPAWDSRIVTGPLMPAAEVRAFNRRIYSLGLAEHVRISRFHGRIPHLLQESDAVVSMAGYNSCAEIMQARIPAVLLPRSKPRQEQLIRARRLDQLGLARCLEELEPGALRSAVEQALASASAAGDYPPLDGLANLSEVIDELTTTRPSRALRARRTRVAAVE